MVLNTFRQKIPGNTKVISGVGLAMEQTIDIFVLPSISLNIK